MSQNKNIVFKPVTPQRASDYISYQIKEMIFSGVLKPDDRLPAERDLAVTFQTGRMTVREALRMLAEKAMGARDLRTMLKHILPNALPPMIVLITLQLGVLILAEASLSFLCIGIKPPGAAWGSMVADGYRYLLSNPMLSFAPGLTIMIVVFAFQYGWRWIAGCTGSQAVGIVIS